MKEYVCVQVGHHKDVGRTIVDYQADGWTLHTYQTGGLSSQVKHYLLFERERPEKPKVF